MERYLAHHGVEGQKWGVRRWQNPDGSLTPAGREHYGLGSLDMNAKYTVKDRNTRMSKYKQERKQLMKSLKQQGKLDNKGADKASKKEIKSAMEAGKKEIDNYLLNKYGEQTVKDVKKEKAIKIGAAATTAVVATVAAYEITDFGDKMQFTMEYQKRLYGMGGFGDTTTGGRGFQNSSSANEDYEITPETRVFRASGDKGENLGSKVGGAYVTTNRQDAAIYDRFLTLRDKDGNEKAYGPKYRSEYSTNKNIKIAGLDTQRKILKDTLKEVDPSRTYSDKDIDTVLMKMNVGTPFRNKPSAEHDSMFGRGRDADFAHDIFDRYQNKMKSAGYGGMVDANDSQTMSKRATYLFGDDNSTFNRKSQKEVNYNPIEKVKDRYYDPSNMFNGSKLKKHLDT